MIVFCPAKINLGLRVLNKRPDGYHTIESVFYHVPLYDVLEFVPATSFSLDSSGLDIPGKPEENLIVKAYELLKKDHALPPLHIHLLKKIPMGSGLGGGSSDVAHFIRGLNNVFDLGLSIPAMEKYAAKIGSDCPFFLHDTPQWVTGRGEELQPIDLSLKGYQLLLVFPDVHIATPEAYAGIIPYSEGPSVHEIVQQPVNNWKDELINDFEKHIFNKYPELAAIKKDLYDAGADYAAMSGSGATLFGLFSTEVNLDAFKWKSTTRLLKFD